MGVKVCVLYPQLSTPGPATTHTHKPGDTTVGNYNRLAGLIKSACACFCALDANLLLVVFGDGVKVHRGYWSSAGWVFDAVTLLWGESLQSDSGPEAG